MTKKYQLDKKYLHVTTTVLILAFSGSMFSGCNSGNSNYTAQDRERLEHVREFADRVLEAGADRWSGQNTPLLADGIHVETGEPAEWREDGVESIIHNLSYQQNLFRVFAGLTNLTGEERYKTAAKEATQYHFDHLISDCGKFHWGGHKFVDLRTLEPRNKAGSSHELKTHFPFYELMWEVDQEATAQYIRAVWDGHVRDWRDLTMNRHASYESGPPPTSSIWENQFDDPEPFFEAPALSFLNAGADLIFSAGMLYGLGGEQGAIDWALRMADMYTKARHPETGMGTYQYTKPSRRNEPPDGPLTGTLTYSSYGDRTENQFGHTGSSDPDDEFYNPVKNKIGPDGKLVAREGWMVRSGGFPWYAVIQLHLAELLGDAVEDFATDAADHLEAYARHSYDPDENHWRAMWADGTDMTGLKVPRTGYHGPKGRVFNPQTASANDMMVYARAYRQTGRPFLWETARSMAQGLGLGDIGRRPGEGVALNMNAPGSDYDEIFALLELYRAAEHPEYLDRARIVADRLIEERFHNGFFFSPDNLIHADFNRLEPLAILSLDAVLRGNPEAVPTHVGSRTSRIGGALFSQ